MRWTVSIRRALVCAALLPGAPLMAQEADSLDATWDGELAAVTMPDEAATAEARAGFLLWLREHPYDLNAVTPEELACLPDITSSDVSAIIVFRKTFGLLSSVEQLRVMTNAPGDLLVEKLRPYVRGPFEGWNNGNGFRVNARFRFSRKAGEDAGLGSPWKSTARVRVETGDEKLEAGVVYEKDAGEPLRQGDLRGGIVLRMPFSWIETIVVGDFALEGGQGLVFWRGNDFRSGDLSSAALCRRGRGVKTQLTTDDLHLLRGGAVAWMADWNHVRITGMHLVSSRMLPGTVESTGVVTSLFEAGAFTTERELARKNAVNERVLGTRIECSVDQEMAVGVSWYRDSFSRPLQQYGGGDRLEVGGVDWSMRFRGARFFGEVARSAGGSAWLAGIACDPEAAVSWGIRYRKYGASFKAFHGQGTGASNEEGIYGCVEIEPLRQVSLSAAADLFASQERTGASPLPVRGSEIAVQVVARSTGPIEITARLRRGVLERCAVVSDTDGRQRRAAVRDVSERLSLKGVARCARGVTMALRLEGTIGYRGSSGARAHGSLLSQSVTWEFPAGRIESHVTCYRADAYEARFTVVEIPCPGALSMALLYGRGWRWSGGVHLKLASSISCSLSSAFGFRDERVDPGKECSPESFQKELGLQIGLNWP